MQRRSFLSAVVAGSFVPAWLAKYHELSVTVRNKVIITDIKTMILQGPRTYTLVRIDTDAGVHGLAEAYRSPGLGIKEAIHGVRDLFIGQDPGCQPQYGQHRERDGEPSLGFHGP